MTEQTVCPYCREKVDPEASICPHCRKNLRVRTAGYQFGLFIGAFGVLMIIGGLLFGSSGVIIVGAVILLVGLALRRSA